ncbi:MAG: 3-oxoacyl-[acyl-carrier-protein] reductase [Acidobacteria bacterium]|nr:3-oxoacyl-[acyl-carrier-protein] reductase [Acidobacteriota bacterium]
MSLEGKIALVTGASQGIGRACALLLAAAGAKVAVASRNLAKLEDLAAEIRQTRHAEDAAAAFELDVASEESIKKCFDQAEERCGPIDILINNAGITRDGLMLRMKRTDWDAVLNTNLTSMFLCIQQVLPGMIRRRQGRIINITSVVSQLGNPGQANYVASKAGINGLTRALALEVASRKVTVNAVAPGFIETAMTEVITPEQKEKLFARIPLGRLGLPADVAHAVGYLASEEASYITGQVIHVNGGMYLAS